MVRQYVKAQIFYMFHVHFLLRNITGADCDYEIDSKKNIDEGDGSEH